MTGPAVSVGIYVGAYPELDVIPGYPVYYAPNLDANYFFYDGDYWVYQGDKWYSSSWYNGPWELVDPMAVPAFILRVPVRYYRRPPAYFRGWAYDSPPHWDQRWGHDWGERRHGWDHWDRGAVPRPAPLPLYQRDYSGKRYPRQIEQQRQLNRQYYQRGPNQPYEGVQHAGPPSAEPRRLPEPERPGRDNEGYHQSGAQPGQPVQGNPWLHGAQGTQPLPHAQPNPPVEQGRRVEGPPPGMPPAPAGQGKNPWLQGTERRPVNPSGESGKSDHDQSYGTPSHSSSSPAQTKAPTGPQKEISKHDRRSTPAKAVNENHPESENRGGHKERREDRDRRYERDGGLQNSDDHGGYTH